MAYRFKFALITFICIILLVPVPLFAEENKKEDESVVIDTFQNDVTGDGHEEKIQLKGIFFSDDSNYYRNIWIEITNDKQDEWTVQLGGGYDPTLQFIDLNHDGIKDILYQSPTGGSGGLYNYELHTFAHGAHEKIELPIQPHVNGQFLDDFRVKIEISPMEEAIIIDVSDRKEEYISLGIYDSNGKSLSFSNPIVDPIAFYEPFVLSDSKGYGLKSYQQISGAYHADRLGTIETVWYFENGQWIVIQTKWVPSETSN